MAYTIPLGGTLKPAVKAPSIELILGSDIASAATISTTTQFHKVTGTTTVTTINPPYPGFVGEVSLVAINGFTLGSGGNINTGGVAVVAGAWSRLITDGTLWYPIGVSLPSVGPGAGTQTLSTGESITLDINGRITAMSTLTRTLTAGTGITGGGTLASDRSFSVDQTFSPSWSGNHTFVNPPISGDGSAGTKSYKFSNASGVSLLSWTPTGVRTLTLPDATDTLVGKATTDNFTNKTLGGTLGVLTDNTYNIGDATHRAATLYTLGLNSGASDLTLAPNAAVLPSVDSTKALGSSTFRWTTINATSGISAGTNLAGGVGVTMNITAQTGGASGSFTRNGGGINVTGGAGNDDNGIHGGASGGSIVIQGGSAGNDSGLGTGVGGGVALRGGVSTSGNGSIAIGATTTSSIAIGASGVVTTFGGPVQWLTDNTLSFGDATHRATALFTLGLNSGASDLTLTPNAAVVPSADLSKNLGATGTRWLAVYAGDFVSPVTATKTTTYTAALGELVRVDPTGAGFTVNLPTAVSKTGQRIIVKNIGTSTNTVTVDANASETIDGQLTYSMVLGYQSITLVSDGANWMII